MDRVVYLCHPATGGGLPDGPWRSLARNTERVVALAAGIEAAHPGIACRFSHGRADAERAEAAILGWCCRLIAGDPDPSALRYVPVEGERRTRVPRGGGGPFGPLPVARIGYVPVSALWVLGPVSSGMAAEVECAVGHGIPVVAVPPAEQTAYLHAGEAAERRRSAERTAAVVDAGLRGLGPLPDFRGARAVVDAYFLAESWVLGCGAVDYERRLGAGVQNGSGALNFRASVEETALRLVRAAALFAAARLDESERVALRARELEGHTFRRVALALGWEDDPAAEDRARRLAARALGKVRAVLRQAEAEQEVTA